MSTTPRQRWLATLKGEKPDRLPTDYWGTPETTARLRADLNCPDDEALWRKLEIDRLRHVAPLCRLKHHPGDLQADIWGIRHAAIDYGAGVYDETAFNPLARLTSVQEVHEYRWPSPDDFDYGAIGEQLAGDDGFRVIQGGEYEPFLLYCALRGLEQAFVDLVENAEICQAILGHIFDFYFEHNRRIFQAGNGKIDLTYLAEDLGGQHGPLFGLETYRRFLRPNQKKMADLARSHGIFVFYHTDGAAGIFLDDLVDVVGIDVLNPIQWRCPGMDIASLVGNFGGRIAFHGGIDNQQTLPFGTPVDVVAEVRQCARLFRGARWICAPCHNIQPVTPTGNIVALYEAAHDIKLD